jgi:hypothetical protein
MSLRTKITSSVILLTLAGILAFSLWPSGDAPAPPSPQNAKIPASKPSRKAAAPLSPPDQQQAVDMEEPLSFQYLQDAEIVDKVSGSIIAQARSFPLTPDQSQKFNELLAAVHADIAKHEQSSAKVISVLDHEKGRITKVSVAENAKIIRQALLDFEKRLEKLFPPNYVISLINSTRNATVFGCFEYPFEIHVYDAGGRVAIKAIGKNSAHDTYTDGGHGEFVKIKGEFFEIVTLTPPRITGPGNQLTFTIKGGKDSGVLEARWGYLLPK